MNIHWQSDRPTINSPVLGLALLPVTAGPLLMAVGGVLIGQTQLQIPALQVSEPEQLTYSPLGSQPWG